MHDVLIYMLDSGYREEVEEMFRNERYRATIAENLGEVTAACQNELFDLVIVWPATVEKTANFITLLEMNKYNTMPVIAVARDAQQLPGLMKLPIVELLQIPMPRAAFFHIIDHVMVDTEVQATVIEGMNWQGSIEEYSLVNLIQMLESSVRDAELIMDYRGKKGHVYFQKGQVINAQFHTLRGIDALRKLAFWPAGNFRTRMCDLSKANNEIGSGNDKLLVLLVEELLSMEPYFQKLPDINEQLIHNPLSEVSKLSPLQHRLALLCDHPHTIFELLISLGDGNEAILADIDALLNLGVIGRRRDVETLVRNREEETNLSRLVSSITSFFSRKEESVEATLDVGGFHDDVIPTILRYADPRLGEADRSRISAWLEEVK